VLGARYRECIGVGHGHLCEGGVVPLTLMGSEIDVVKLLSQLELMLRVAPAMDDDVRGPASAILSLRA
jgi:uncharacterized protein (DUF1810 family)